MLPTFSSITLYILLCTRDLGTNSFSFLLVTFYDMTAGNGASFRKNEHTDGPTDVGVVIVI